MSDPLPPPPPAHSAVQSDSWFKRNWWWSVPGGCCGCLVLFIGFFAAIALLVFGILKNSDVYEDALAMAQTDTRLQAELGTPIEPGIFVSGNMNTNGTGGSADLAIPLSGPQGSATLYVEAEKSGGAWRFTYLEAKLDSTGALVNLLEAD